MDSTLQIRELNDSKKHPLLSTEFPADPKWIQYLKDDSLKYPSIYANYDRWDINKLINREVTVLNPVTFYEMLPLWIGNTKIVADSKINEYLAYARKHGLEQQYNDILLKQLQINRTCFEIDLSLIQDYLLIDKFFPKKFREKK